MDDEEMIAFRLPRRDRAAIQRLVNDGQFQNRSDFLRHAVRQMLREHEPKAGAKLDLELEGVELPQQPARARGRSPLAKRGNSR